MSGIRNAYILLVFTLTVIFAVDRTYGQGGPCTTLRDEPGVCVPILTCWTITELFRISPRPLPPSVNNQVRQSYCGTFRNIHHVCCDPKRVTGGETTTTTTPSPVTTPKKSIIRSGIEKSEDDVRAGIAMLQTQKNCGKSDADRIANGENANLSEFPWMALLIYTDGIVRTEDCGGTLIHERYVLTAAHCIRARGKRLVSVRLGEHDTQSDVDCEGEGDKRKCAPPTQEIDVEEAIYHKDYNPARFSDDMGLLRLVSNAVIRTNVRPVCLPITQKSRQYQLSHMIISGWGRIENGTKATILQKATIPMKTIEYCQQIHTLVRFTQKQLCAGAENEIDTCKGDSGGPLFYIAPYNFGVRYIQYGVVSAGSVVCGSDNPGIYARVEAYLPWIASNLT
ncbi:serine protease grass-like [Episyrphus balteatus]|uniref:serine protease grass-like n=1 Tax=Episyrphus balteatus TaxID=286459 RepID=UPI0024854CAF|nr:serine protease grass-like [Episyrphus balteatus]